MNPHTLVFAFTKVPRSSRPPPIDSTRRLRVTLALSVLIHAGIFWNVTPQVRAPSPDTLEQSRGAPPLVVRLMPKAPPVPVHTPPQRLPREVPAKSQRRSPPPVLARKPIEPRPEYRAPADIPPARTAPARAEPRAEGDLAAYVEARRRARVDTGPAAAAPIAPTQEAEDENTRANRIAAANLASARNRAPAEDSRRGGGVFGIQYMSHEYAEFLFYGWNRNFGRATTQLVEVRKGTQSDIRTAVVQSMIAIIRDHEPGDFVWESRRLGRNVTLSARPRDEAGLQDFLMQEFFPQNR